MISRKIRLLYVTTSTDLGGAEKMLTSVIGRLDLARYEVAVISLNRPGAYAEQLKALGIPVESIYMRGVPSLAGWWKLRRWIRTFRPDLIHAFLYKAVQVTRLVTWPTHPLILSSPRISYRTMPGWAHRVDRFLMSRDVATLAESQATERFLVEHLGYHGKRVRVVHNGVDLDCWRQRPDARDRLRAELVPGGEPLILSVGRLVPQKGFTWLLKALAVLDQGLPWRAAIVGNGPLHAELTAQVDALGLRDRVLLLGERRDVPDLLSAADCFVLPSLWEGMPNAVLEAMACGLPTVATAVDGTTEIIEHETSGLLVPPAEAAPLATALQRVLVDPELRKRLAAQARVRVEAAFDLQETVKRYYTIYEEILQEQGAAR